MRSTVSTRRSSGRVSVASVVTASTVAFLDGVKDDGYSTVTDFARFRG